MEVNKTKKNVERFAENNSRFVTSCNLTSTLQTPQIKCRYKGCKVKDDKKLEEHHLIPRFMGGTDSDGRKRLCEKHHDIIHKIIPKIIFQLLSKEQREQAKREVKKVVLSWLEK